mgnify:CR=1 FL=1
MSTSSKKWLFGIGLVALLGGLAWALSGGFGGGLIEGYKENQAENRG